MNMKLLQKKEIPIEAYRTRVGIIGTALPWVPIGYGITMPIGGNERWQGHSLEPLMFFEGAATFWGTILLIGGMLLAIGQLTDIPMMILIGGWICGLWFSMASITTFTQSIAEHDPVFYAGAGLWGFMALNCLVHAYQRIDHHSKPVEEPSSSQNQ